MKKAQIFLLLFLCLGCSPEKEDYIWTRMEVTATAYNSVRSQTDHQPNITAWGDTLKPGMKCIAVSRDLLALGLTHNTPVKIEGLKGTYYIKDKMHYRWRNKIDIYMGKDINAAREWGRKKVQITYGILKDNALKKP